MIDIHYKVEVRPIDLNYLGKFFVIYMHLCMYVCICVDVLPLPISVANKSIIAGICLKGVVIIKSNSAAGSLNMLIII